MGAIQSVLAAIGISNATKAPPLRVEPEVRGAELRQPLAYSPVDTGLQRLSVSELLGAHEALIGRIKLCYGADRPTFEKDILRPISNYAAFVNGLPATADNYFSNHGGLFRLGLEVAFFALQGTDAHIVSGRATISARRQLEPRWRQATFIAGLCAELHRTLSHITVTDRAGNEWPSYLGALTPWLVAQRADRFFVRWIANAQESRTAGLFALQYIVPSEVLQHLATGNSMVVPHLFASISGMPLYRDHNVLDELVRRASALVMDRDLTASSDRYGKAILGAHLERYLIDAMRRLVVGNTAWGVNQERSRIWLSRDGLFIVWPQAAADIRKLLEADQLPGIPKSPETIVEILMAAGVLEENADGGPLWSILPPLAKNQLDAIKLSSENILTAALPEPPPALQQSILAPARGPHAATQVPPAPPTLSAAPASAEEARTATRVPDERHDEDDAQIDLPLAPTSAPRIAEQEAALPAPTLSANSSGAGRASSSIREPPPQPQFRLQAPLRLLPDLREALAEIVASLNGDGKLAAACTVPAGLFIPISELAKRRLDTALALRTLADLGMLAGSRNRPKTVEHDFGAKPAVGIVLDVKHVSGLNPADFAVSD